MKQVTSIVPNKQRKNFTPFIMEKIPNNTIPRLGFHVTKNACPYWLGTLTFHPIIRPMLKMRHSGIRQHHCHI
jgi:hypothetical protein